MGRIRFQSSALALVLYQGRRFSPAAESIVLVGDDVVDGRSDRGLIVGGYEAGEGRRPYMASLQLRGRHFCGGSLIARDVVLSAAHCRRGGGGYDVVLGRHDLDDLDDGEAIAVAREIRHPGYDEEGTDNDFMLLFLDRPYAARDVDLVGLNSDGSVPSAGQRVTDMGWGDTRIDEEVHVNSDVLRRVDLSALSNEDCDASEGWYYDPASGWKYGSCEDFITDNMLCAWAYRSGSCQGDSGGPLVIRGDGRDLQVGVSSWMIDCASDDFPGVYARVSRAYGWIEEEVCNGSEYASEAGFDCDDDGAGTGHDDEEIPNATACTVCSGGLTVPAARIIPYPEANGASCAKLLEYAAAGVRPEVCEEMKLAEAICCPPQAATPCRVCSDGITVEGTLSVFKGSTKTCGDLAVDSMVTEDGSDECNRMKSAEPVCCPDEDW